MTDILQRITTDPARRGGQPCIRHLRITVRDIAIYRAGGMTPAQILQDFPSLEPADLEACEAYVAAHPEVLEDDPQPERLTITVPGLRGVQIHVDVPRDVWNWFDGLQGAVRIPGDGTPLEVFRQFLTASARDLFSNALAEFGTAAEAAHVAGFQATKFLVPTEFVSRALETSAQVPPQSAARTIRVLTTFLAEDPDRIKGVELAIRAGLVPASRVRAAREILASARRLVAARQ